MKQSLLASLIVAGLGFATGAQADPVVTDFNFITPDGTTSAQQSLDWNANGSGVGIGVGPFGNVAALQPGNTFTFLYQANLVTVNPGGISTNPNLDTSSNGTWSSTNAYEFTVVTRLYEVVEALVGPVPIGTTGTNLYNATFGLNPNLRSTVSIFFDSAAMGGQNASTTPGTGFDDGLEILRMTITNGVPGFATLSNFSALVGGTGGGTGQGSAKIYADLSSPGDFVNANYLQGILAFIYDLEFQSNLNYPPGDSAAAAFHTGPDASGLYPAYTVDLDCGTENPCDLQLKVDGDNTFSANVPEPGTLALLGMGLLGLGTMRRRHSA